MQDFSLRAVTCPQRFFLLGVTSKKQNAEISLVQNDPPLIFKQSLLIIGQKPYLRQTRGEGGENEKIQITVVQHPEISIFCGCNRFFN